MTNFARIINNVAVDVSHDPENHFHPDIAAEFVSVPDQVRHGWRLVDGAWLAPEIMEPATPTVAPLVPEPVTQVDPVQFQLLFTSAERVALKAARATDPVIDDFFDIATDPRLTTIRLNAQTTVEAIGYFVRGGFVTEDRAAQILAGVSPT